jgi:hypothetical protein
MKTLCLAALFRPMENIVFVYRLSAWAGQACDIQMATQFLLYVAA